MSLKNLRFRVFSLLPQDIKIIFNSSALDIHEKKHSCM
jgi:hypothetical protein